MKAASETASTIAYVVVGIILAVSINSVSAVLLDTDLPIVAVQSDSMDPTFYKGDLLILDGINKTGQDVKIGDIIVFSPAIGVTPVVHRIITINPDGTYQTKGDANAGQLPYEKSIQAKDIHGKVILIIPYLGWIKIAVVETALPFILSNSILMIIAAAILYALYAVARKRKNI